MDDSEEKDSKEDFLSYKNVSDVKDPPSDTHTSHDSPSLEEEPREESFFNPARVSCSDKDAEKFEPVQSAPPASDVRLIVPELNHLNALANLDPSLKFPESASMHDMRFPPNLNTIVEDDTSKVFLCHLCDFKTAYANSLMNHQAVHSDVRPWACAMCEYAAKRKQDLKKHLHTVHGMMVESPMLKPIGGPSSNFGGTPKLPPIANGFKDQFPEGLNLKRPSSSDHEFPFYPMASSSHQLLSAKRIKEEFSPTEMMSPPSHERKMTSASETEDSPDDNLPISFSQPMAKSNDHSHSKESPQNPELVLHVPSNRENGELNLPFGVSMPWLSKKREKSHESVMRDWPHYPTSREELSFQPGFMREKVHRHESTTSNSSPQIRVRDNSFGHSLSEEDHVDEMQNRRASVESLKPIETDRSISSSSTVSHVRSTQTQSGFMCEHCDILFFQRAMFLMHIGLHSPNDPWCCAVCGSSFSEKYSFTSHFINQH